MNQYKEHFTQEENQEDIEEDNIQVPNLEEEETQSLNPET